MNNSILNYTGIVKLEYMYRGKIMHYEGHNNGLELLFKLYAKALAGEDVRSNRPTYIDVRVESSTDTWTSVLNVAGLATGTYFSKDSSGDWCTRITATLASYQFAQSPQEEKNYRFYLCSADGDLAFLPVTGTSLTRIGNGTQAIIEWVLKVSNPQAETPIEEVEE